MTEIFKKILGMLIAENQEFELVAYEKCKAIMRCDPKTTDVIWVLVDDPLWIFEEKAPLLAFEGDEKFFQTAEEYVKEIHLCNSLYAIKRLTS